MPQIRSARSWQPPVHSIVSHSPEETARFGRWLGSRLPSPAIVGLDGPLGAGKTWLAKGIVCGIGRFDAALVKSPAYNLIHEYVMEDAPRTVFHIDFYRLEVLTDHDALLFLEILEKPDGIVLVEWAARHLGVLAPEFLSVTLETGASAHSRVLTVREVGARSRYGSIIEACRSYADPDS